MPNRATHIFFGVLLGFVGYFVFTNQLGIPVSPWSWIAIAIFSFLPDVLEPATSYTHRNIFHSKRTLKYVGLGTLISLPLSIFFPIFQIMLFGGIGYTSHLLLDATTKMSLPD